MWGFIYWLGLAQGGLALPELLAEEARMGVETVWLIAGLFCGGSLLALVLGAGVLVFFLTRKNTPGEQKPGE